MSDINDDIPPEIWNTAVKTLLASLRAEDATEEPDNQEVEKMPEDAKEVPFSPPTELEPVSPSK